MTRVHSCAINWASRATMWRSLRISSLGTPGCLKPQPTHYPLQRNLELCCIVWIEPGVERTVPLAATDRTNEPIEVFPICLSVRSVQQLVQVYQLIMGTPAPGADNGRLASDPSLHRESPESPSSDSGGRSDYTPPSLAVLDRDAATERDPNADSDQPRTRSGGRAGGAR